MDTKYGWEKLHGAIYSLCGLGDQRERLITAISHSLMLIEADRHLPEAIAEDFKAFMRTVAPDNSHEEGLSVRNKISNLGEFEVMQKIDSIIGFYDAICRHRQPLD